MTPAYEISLANKIIHNRLSRLIIHDTAGHHGDTLQLVLNGEGLAKPELGVTISIRIGYEETEIWDAGTFVVQEVERFKSAKRKIPNTIVITGISQSQNNETQAALQLTSAERAFQNQTFGEIVKTIASANGLTTEIDGSLESIPMPPIRQTLESDAGFLDRIARERNAFVKYNDNRVIVQVYDSETIGEININSAQISEYRYHEVQKRNVKKVVAKYTDIKTGKTMKHEEGSGGKQFVLGETFPDLETAKQKAEAVLKYFQRDLINFTIDMPTQPGMFAEKVIHTFHMGDAELNGKWIARSVTTTLDESGLESKLRLQPTSG